MLSAPGRGRENLPSYGHPGRYSMGCRYSFRMKPSSP